MADETPLRPYYPPPPGGYVTAQPMRRSRWVLALSMGAVIVVLLFLAGVKFYMVFQRSGQAEIVPLHEEMKRMDTAAIYASADPSYRAMTTREQSDSYFQSVHDALGGPLSYTVAGTYSGASTARGSIRSIVLQTHFARGDATESLVFRKTDGAWHLLRYRCTSPLLKDVNPPKVVTLGKH
jgi:hypothetical protein